MDENQTPTIDQTPLETTPVALNRKLMIILAFVAGFLILGGVAYWYSQKVPKLVTFTGESDKSLTATPVTPATSTAFDSAKVDEIADWETYNNATLGFSFQYPLNFRIDKLPYIQGLQFVEDPASLRLRLLLTQDIYVGMAQNPALDLKIIKTAKTIDEMVAYVQQKTTEGEVAMLDPQNMGYGKEPPKINSIEKVTLNQIEMTKVARFGGPGAPNVDILEYYYKSPAGDIYIFSANYDISNPSAKRGGVAEEELLPKILSTFKFTDPTDETAGWKTYSSTLFTLRYPSSWFIEDSSRGLTISSCDNSVPSCSKEPSTELHLAVVVVTYDDTQDLFDFIMKTQGSISHTDVVVDGIKSIENTWSMKPGSNARSLTIFVPKGKNLAQITARPADSKYLSTFDQILATFKFN